jgi:hypothetical protein
MNSRLKDRLVVITGASSGIGEKIAGIVAESGGHLVLLARRKDRLKKLSDELQASHSISCTYYELDVSDLDAVSEVFTDITENFDRVDVLVNNAGFGIFRNAEEATFEEMQQMFKVNVFGLIAATKLVLPKMLAQREGHIINVASQAGKIATPKSSIYSATKHAVLGFTNSLRMEVADRGIFVTSVNPGPIETDFFNLADTSGDYVKNVQRWMLNPEAVAQKIVSVMLTNKREINMPVWMELGGLVYRLMPSLFEKVAGNLFRQK